MVRSQHVILALLAMTVALLGVIAWQLLDDDALPITLENANAQAAGATDDLALATLQSRNGDQYLAVVSRATIRRGPDGGTEPVRYLALYTVDNDRTLRVAAVRRIEWDGTLIGYNCSEADMGNPRDREQEQMHPDRLQREATGTGNEKKQHDKTASKPPHKSKFHDGG